MVQFKAAVWSVLLGLALTASALPHSGGDGDVSNGLERRDAILVPRGDKQVDPAKIERMRGKLGPRYKDEEDDEEEEEIEEIEEPESSKPKPKTKAKTPPPKDTVNRKSNGPPPEIVKNSNNGKVPESIAKLQGLKRPQPQKQDELVRFPVLEADNYEPVHVDHNDSYYGTDLDENEDLLPPPPPPTRAPTTLEKGGKKVPPQSTSVSKPRGQQPQPQPQKDSQQRRPFAPKRPFDANQAGDDVESDGEYQPTPRRNERGPQPQPKANNQPQRGQSQRRPNTTPQQRSAPKKQTPPPPQPEEDEGANQKSPQTKKAGGGDNKQKPNKTKPKLPAAGPSKFQTKKAEKFGGPKAAQQPRRQPQPQPQPEDEGDDEDVDQQSALPVPKKKPQVAPTISQGGPRDRSDGSSSRKKANRPDGSKYRKQGPPSEEDDEYEYQGSELAAKDAVQSAGGPKEGLGPAGSRKSGNKPTTQNKLQTSAKKPPASQPQPIASDAAAGDSEATAKQDQEEKAEADYHGDGNNYFQWYRGSEQRPTDFIQHRAQGWKDKFTVPEEATQAPRDLSPTPPSGLDKLPANQRQREQEQRELEEKEEEEKNIQEEEKNKKARRRKDF